MRYTRVYLALAAAGLTHGTVFAQEVDERDAGTIGVQGNATLGSGYMLPGEDAPKSRSNVSREAMDKQETTANAVDRLQYTPSLNIASDDATGLSSFSFTMRGMNSDQIGMSGDGMPLNDSGNYALYSNLLGDPENLEQIAVVQGASDPDGPHIGSSGGNITLTTIRPTKEPGVFAKQSVGSNSTYKTFARLNTGEWNGLSNWLSASHTEGKMWRGHGRVKADKVEWSSLYDHGDGNTANLILKYHEQENNSYSHLTKGEFEEYGRKYEPYSNPASLNSDGKIDNYYGLAQNPFQTFTGVLNTHFQLRDDLALSVIPYYYWGNGSGSGAYPSSLNSDTSSSGVYDLGNLPSANDYANDGFSNTGVYYRPSRTQTWRPGITTKLDWDLDDHSLQFGYWYERARQLQTQPYISLKSSGKPQSVWPDSDEVRDANGNIVQGRNRYTVTPAQKLWIQDTWYANPDWTLNAGVSYMHVERKGDNRGSLTEQPEKRSQTYDKFLPTLGIGYALNDSNQLFYNLTRNMRVPYNYVLYDQGEGAINLKPETSWSNELGWRYTRGDMALSATLFYLQFENRQVSSRDENGDYTDINAGDVDNKGLELEWSGLLPNNFNYYASYTYTDAKQKNDLTVYNNGEAIDLPTSGKQFANVPKHMLAANIGYDDGRYYGTIGAKYTSKLYGDLTNDESISDRTIFNLGAGAHLPVSGNWIKDATLRLNVDNLFDKKYLAGVYTYQTNSEAYGGYRGGDPAYIVGIERTVTVSLEANF